MSSSPDKFSKHYKKSFKIAKELAQDLNQPTIEPWHVLYGLTAERGSVGAEIFSSFEAKTDDIKNLISRSSQNNDQPAEIDVKIEPRLSTTSKKLIQKSVQIAYLNRHPYIGTEHLLAALIQINDEKIKNIFNHLKISESDLIDKTVALLKSASKFPDLTETFKAANQRQPAFFDDFLGGGNNNKSFLDAFGRELTAKKIQETIDPVIAREAELERIIEILCRRRKNNPIILGEPGVGKTALAEGLAKKIVEGAVPPILKNKKIYALDLASAVAGTMYRGDFENRLKKIIDEAKSRPEVILFIDEIHNIVGAGSASGSLDLANILKPALARGEIRCLGATTFEDYRKSIESDPALDRRFQPVRISEPNREQAKEILLGLKTYFEQFHQVQISEAAILTAIDLSQKYLPDKFLPDKAIDLLDEACARKKINRPISPMEKTIAELTQKIKQNNQAKKEAILKEDFAAALKFKEETIRLNLELAEIKRKQGLIEINQEIITLEDIARVVAKITRLPLADLLTSEKNQILKLEKELKEKVIGQDEALKTISDLLKIAKAGLREENKPLAALMFVGPSGSGKTYTATKLAELLFNSRDALIKIDMSEYSEKFNLSKLIGAPAGYVGYKESGQLTERVKHHPYSLILLDEIEKANKDIFDLFLSVLADGYLTDATGNRINFRNTIIIMTSNLGSEFWLKNNIIGFGQEETAPDFKNLTEKTREEIKKYFKVEFLNRLDQIIFFSPLAAAELKKIARLELEKIKERLAQKQIKADFDPKIINLIAKLASENNQEGARKINKISQQIIEIPLSQYLLENKIRAGDDLLITAEDNEMRLLKKNVIIKK